MFTAPSLSFSRQLHPSNHLHRPSSAAPSFVPRATSIPMAVASVTTAPSLYEVLDVRSAASGQEIKAAYRKLARACHPDVVAVHRKDMSADKFMRIHAAYETLSDPEKRADYDRSLLKVTNRRVMYRSTSFSSSSSSPSPRGSPSSFSSFTTRRYWETDQCW